MSAAAPVMIRVPTTAGYMPPPGSRFENGALHARRLAELVGDDAGEGVTRPEDVRADVLRAPDEQRNRDRLADGATEPDHDRRRDPAPAVWEHRPADHLPPRCAESERRFLQRDRRGREH